MTGRLSYYDITTLLCYDLTYQGMTPGFKQFTKNIIDSNTKHSKGFVIGSVTINYYCKKTMNYVMNTFYYIINANKS